MKSKTTYSKDPVTRMWSFVINNTKTRTTSEPYVSKKQAMDAVKNIKDGLKPYKKP